MLRTLGRVPGVRVHVLSSDPRARIRFSRYCTTFFHDGPCATAAERIGAISRAVRKAKADVVLPVDRPAVRLLSEHRGALPRTTTTVPIPDTENFDRASDKWRMAGLLAKHRIPTPETLLYLPGAEFEQRLLKLTFPVLVKPATGEDGRRIVQFDTPSDVLRFLEDDDSMGNVIVQSFAAGYDIDCSVLCRDGRILASTTQRGFIRGYHPFGPAAGVWFLKDRAVSELVARVVAALNWSGVAHVDMRYDSRAKGFKVLEVNPRYWGTLFGSLIAGVNFPYLSCRAALGLELPRNESVPARFVAGRAALRILGRRLIARDDSGVRLRDTSLRFMLDDPLPELLGTGLARLAKSSR